MPAESAVVGAKLVAELMFVIPAKDGSVDNEPKTSRYSRVSVPAAQRSEEIGRSSESFEPSQCRKASRHFIAQNSVRQLTLVFSTDYWIRRFRNLLPNGSASASGYTVVFFGIVGGFRENARSSGEFCRIRDKVSFAESESAGNDSLSIYLTDKS